jgi:hypothetical protein
LRWVYEGLLWNGALQVDPGWNGNLFCPIFNLSNEEVVLRLHQPIVLMDFVKTTPFKKGVTVEYDRPPKRSKLQDYNWRLKSALFTDAAQRLAGVEKKVEEAERKVSRAESVYGIVLTCLALLFAALAILITSAEKTKIVVPLWLHFSPVLAVVAIVISLGSIGKRGGRRTAIDVIALCCLVITAIALVCLAAATLWLFG